MAKRERQPAYARPASTFPKVKQSALVGPKRPTGRPKPLATKAGVTRDGKRLY